MKVVITESQYNYLLEQSMFGWSGGLPKDVKSSDITKGWTDSMDLSIDTLRDMLYSPEGIATSVLTNLDPSGTSQVIVRCLFLILLIDDIIQWIEKGEPNWLYLICDTLCLFSGGFTNSLIPKTLISKSGSLGLSKTLSSIEKLYKPFFESVLTPFIKNFSYVINFIKSFVSKYFSKVQSISKKLKFNVGNKINILFSKLDDLWKELDLWLKSFLTTYARYKSVEMSLDKFAETKTGKRTIRYILPTINPLLGSDKLDPFLIDLISDPNKTLKNLNNYNIDDYFKNMQ